MNLLEFNIDFELSADSTVDAYISEFTNRLNTFFVNNLGLIQVEDTGIFDGTELDENNQPKVSKYHKKIRILKFKYKSYEKPYIYIDVYHCEKVGTYPTPNYIGFRICNTDVNGSINLCNETILRNISDPPSISCTLTILKSNGFLCITNKGIPGIATIGKNGVLFCKAKNPFTEETEDVFGDYQTESILDVNTSNLKKMKYLEDGEFKVLGALSAPDTNKKIHFMKNRLILIPAFISESYTTEVYYKDWYIDEIYVSLNDSFVQGEKYAIDNKTYLAITSRALVELTL